MTARSRDGDARPHSIPTRRGVLLGAVGLAGLGGTLAGCSTAAVPFDANEAGVPPRDVPAPSAMAVTPPGSVPTARSPASLKPKDPAARGVPLGAARDIPVGGGTVFAAARVVVTQPARGRYRAFSAVCTHVGCIVNRVAGGTIHCPCHGSQFEITSGAVAAGPAPSPLPEKQIAIAGGRIMLM
jgi:Rieske Fe-S protein